MSRDEAREELRATLRNVQTGTTTVDEAMWYIMRYIKRWL